MKHHVLILCRVINKYDDADLYDNDYYLERDGTTDEIHIG